MRRRMIDMKRSSAFDHRQIFQHLFLILVVLGVFISFRSIAGSQTDFYNNLWAPTHLLVQGESPYHTEALHASLPALWMPTAIGAFSFLGFLNFGAAQQIWFLLNILGASGLLYFSLQEWSSTFLLAAGAFFVYFFPATVMHLALGQISILAALSLLLAVNLSQKAPWLSAFFLAVGMVKPQIGFLILFGLCIRQFQLGGFKALFSYGMKSFVAALILCLPIFIAKPNWIPDFIASLQSNTSAWTHPSILSQLDTWIGNWKYLPWGALLLGVLWTVAWLWRHFSLHIAALWTLALTVLVTPYVWSWDFVLLLPLFVYVFSISSWKGRTFLALGYLLVAIGMTVIQLSDNFHNSRFWWVPLCFLTLIILVARLKPINRSQYKI